MKHKLLTSILTITLLWQNLLFAEQDTFDCLRPPALQEREGRKGAAGQDDDTIIRIFIERMPAGYRRSAEHSIDTWLPLTRNGKVYQTLTMIVQARNWHAVAIAVQKIEQEEFSWLGPEGRRYVQKVKADLCNFLREHADTLLVEREPIVLSTKGARRIPGAPRTKARRLRTADINLAKLEPISRDVVDEVMRLLTVGKRLERLMAERPGWTSQIVADLSGVSYPTVRGILNGNVEKPNIETVRKLASAFPVDGQILAQGIYKTDQVKLPKPPRVKAKDIDVTKLPPIPQTVLDEVIQLPTVRQRLERLMRERPGWDAQVVADLSGVSIFTVRNILNGKVDIPNKKTTKRLAAAFPVDEQVLAQGMYISDQPRAPRPPRPKVVPTRPTPLPTTPPTPPMPPTSPTPAPIPSPAEIEKTARANQQIAEIREGLTVLDSVTVHWNTDIGSDDTVGLIRLAIEELRQVDSGQADTLQAEFERKLAAIQAAVVRLNTERQKELAAQARTPERSAIPPEERKRANRVIDAYLIRSPGKSIVKILPALVASASMSPGGWIVVKVAIERVEERGLARLGQEELRYLFNAKTALNKAEEKMLDRQI